MGGVMRISRVFIALLSAAWMFAAGFSAGVRAEEPVVIKRVQHVDFRDLPLADALRLLSEQTGINLAATTDARKVPVSLFLRDVTAQSAIEELCKTNDLAWKQDPANGIIRISTLQEFQKGLIVPRVEKTEIFTLLYPNAVSIALAIRDLHGDRVLLSLGRDGAADESNDLEDRFDRFDVIDSRSQGLGIFGGGSTTTSGGFGGGNGSNGSGFGSGRSSGGFSNSGINSSTQVRRSDRNRDDNRRDTNEFKNLTPDQAQAVQKALLEGKAETDAALQALRRQQVDIYVAVSRKNNMLMIRTSDAVVLEDIRELVKKLDVPTPLVLLEVKVLSIDLGDSFTSVFDYQFSDGVNNAAGLGSGVVQPPAADTLSGVARRAAPLLVGGSGLNSGALLFQFVNNNFRARLQMLEDKNKITTLATPLLLTANNEVSRLFVGEERPIIRNISSNTVVNNNTVTSTPNTTVEFRPVGTTLLITPNINSDRTVTLRILQENSTINPGAANIPVVTGDGSVQQQNVDVVATRTISGTIIAKDELMVAVGGLIEDNVHDQRSQVPVLGRIPVLGIPFRKQATGRERHELIVLCKPHILSTPAEAQALSQKLMLELSLHPSSPDGHEIKAFSPREVIRPQPPQNAKDATLKRGIKYDGD